MVDQEVESILLEIRERVRSASPPAPLSSTAATATESTPASNGNHETTTAESLALIESYLTTTARAWDRLPPLVSNRSGAPARVELWIKRQLKRAMRWFTWEQVNFNAAVHHALVNYQRVLETQRAELQRIEQGLAQSEVERQKLRDELTAHSEAQQGGLLQEIRERDERLLDEQRVCFKQLSLETGEAAVLEDRARRKVDAALDELKQRIEELEKR